MSGNQMLAVGDEQIAELESKETKATEQEEATTTSVETALSEQGETSAEVSAEESKGESETAESADEHKHYYGDVPVEVEVPQEIASAFAEHKIDTDKLLDELFAKDGKFELSEETRKPLDKAFGKHIVDGYLNLYRSQNQMFMDKHAADSAAQQKQLADNSADFDTMVGGETGWNELAEWAGSNMTEGELAQFNAVMQLGSEHYTAQKTVIEALQLKRLHSLGEKAGDQAVTLLTDSGSGGGKPTDGLPASLSMTEYHQLMQTTRYKTDKTYELAVDNLRRVSKAAGK